MSSTSPQWFELSFVMSNLRERVAIRSTLPDALTQISKTVELATKGYLPTGSGDPQFFSVIQIPEDPISGAASSLLETIAKETAIEDGFSSDASMSIWNRLCGLASDIDARAQSAPGPLRGVEVGFMWDNGGMDDNAFDDGFCAAPHSGQGPDPVLEFLDALEEWGKEECVWYDFRYDTSPSLDPLHGRMSLEQFKDWVEEIADGLPSFMPELVESLFRYEMEIRLDETLPPPRPSLGPRRL